MSVRFVSFTDTDDLTVYVNPEHVVSVREEGSVVTLTTTATGDAFRGARSHKICLPRTGNVAQDVILRLGPKS